MFDKLFLWRQHIFFEEALVNNIPCWEVSGHHKGGPITCRCLPHSHLLCVLPHHGCEVSCRGAGRGKGKQVSYQSLKKDVSNDTWAPISSHQAWGSLSLQIPIRWRRDKTHQLPNFIWHQVLSITHTDPTHLTTFWRPKLSWISQISWQSPVAPTTRMLPYPVPASNPPRRLQLPMISMFLPNHHFIFISLDISPTFNKVDSSPFQSTLPFRFP